MAASLPAGPACTAVCWERGLGSTLLPPHQKHQPLKDFSLLLPWGESLALARLCRALLFPGFASSLRTRSALAGEEM